MTLLALLVACTADGPNPHSDADTSATEDSGDPGPTGPPVIIGAGLAGLAAAADLPGAIVLEAADVPGGRAAGEGQRRFLFVDSAVELAADWPTMTGGEASDTTLRYLDESAAVHDRMETLGVTFLDPPGADLLTGRLDLFTVELEGPELAQAFVAAMAAGAELRLSTPVTGLVVDDSGVIGVQTSEGVISTNRVLLATGGYTGRVDIVEQYAVWPPGTWSSPHEEVSGFAWDLAQTLGLGLDHLDDMGAFDGYLGDFADGKVRPFTGGVPLIWVDTGGARFVNEYELGSIELEAAFWGHAPATVVSTREDILAAAYPGFEADYEAVLRCYDSFEALAAAEGVDPAGLRATVSSVAAVRAGDTDDPLGRAGYTFPSLEGTPCAATAGRKTAKSYGGVTVDEGGRALNAEGAVMPGLWVAGEAAGMGAPGMGGQYGFDGSLSAVVWSGWRAAASMQEAGLAVP